MFNDYELLYFYRLNPTEGFTLMMEAYRNLMFKAIHQVCFNFNGVCFSVDDAYQESLISLLNALEGYRFGFETTFSSYLFTCVMSSTRLLVRKHRGLSYGLLDRSYSLSYPITIDESLTLGDVVAEEKAWYQPQMMADYQEIYKVSMAIIKTLKPFEKKVFELRNEGCSYQEVSEITGLTSKKVDNILQKIRRKVKAELEGA